MKLQPPKINQKRNLFLGSKGGFIFTQTFKTNPVLQEILRSEDVS